MINLLYPKTMSHDGSSNIRLNHDMIVYSISILYCPANRPLINLLYIFNKFEKVNRSNLNISKWVPI